MIAHRQFPIPALHSRRRKGFTLTEIAIVLGIISIILAGVWMAAGQVNEKARVTQVQNEMNAVAQNMTSMLQGGYGANIAIVNPCAAAPTPCNITAPMITAKAIPQWIGTGTSASTPWNPTGFILSWIAANPRTYRISLYNITRNACLELSMQATNCTPGQPGCPVKAWSKGVQPAVGGFNLPGSAAVDLTATPMTSAGAEALCLQNTYPGGGAAANSLEFDYTQ
jgi:prepilin-type N-terminal cleavage/methylation domain-containing protein